MRGIIQFGMAAICIGLVGAGLFMSLENVDKGVLLDKQRNRTVYIFVFIIAVKDIFRDLKNSRHALHVT